MRYRHVLSMKFVFNLFMVSMCTFSGGLARQTFSGKLGRPVPCITNGLSVLSASHPPPQRSVSRIFGSSDIRPLPPTKPIAFPWTIQQISRHCKVNSSLLFKKTYVKSNFKITMHTKRLKRNTLIIISTINISSRPGASCKNVIWGGTSLLPSLPYPSLTLPFHLLRSRPPSLRLGGLGERFSSPRGSGRNPAAKRYLVNLRLKISPLVATIFRSFSRDETSNWGRGDWVAKWYYGNILHFLAGLPKKPSV